ncbi:hypothetical protein VCHA53O466_50036 [Vibrio chagasii]|nr:hypothetical protein VCHA53O466_50036 [Vibrio chagasii]
MPFYLQMNIHQHQADKFESNLILIPMTTGCHGKFGCFL